MGVTMNMSTIDPEVIQYILALLNIPPYRSTDDGQAHDTLIVRQIIRFMDGRAATRAIRSLEDPELSHIPIIALTADAFESDRLKSIECGMDAHLTKPIDVPVLLETIAHTVYTHTTDL